MQGEPGMSHTRPLLRWEICGSICKWLIVLHKRRYLSKFLKESKSLLVCFLHASEADVIGGHRA